MIWVNGQEYADKEEAFRLGAITDEQRIILTTCPCCGDNELDKIKLMFEMYDKQAERIHERQIETRDFSDEIDRVKAQAAADAYGYVLHLLEGKGGCL